MNPWRTSRGPLLYAHRGANQEYPENSMAALRRAVELGADILEIDVHCTADDHFVVCHDPDGVRMAGVARQIGECTWQEVGQWDVGVGYYDERGEQPFRAAGFRLATLREVIGAFDGVGLNVDVKGATRRQLSRLVDMLDELGASDRVLLTSFSARTLRRLRSFGYPGPLGMARREVAELYFLPAPVYVLLSRAGRRVQVPLRFGPWRLAEGAFIDKCHRLGLGVDYWVVNDTCMAERLLQEGADGIVTDDVAAMRELFERSVYTQGWRERHQRC